MKTLIVLGGDPPDRTLAERYFAWADRVLCTDSGANALTAWGLWPDLLIGDMDSIAPGTLWRPCSKRACPLSAIIPIRT